MRDPWFTYYRGPGWQMQLVPRNGKGWMSLIGYLLAVTLPGFIILPWFLRASMWLLLPWLVGVGLVTFAWTRWSITKAERVDLSNLEEFREWQRRNKGRQ